MIAQQSPKSKKPFARKKKDEKPFARKKKDERRHKRGTELKFVTVKFCIIWIAKLFSIQIKTDIKSPSYQKSGNEIASSENYSNLILQLYTYTHTHTQEMHSFRDEISLRSIPLQETNDSNMEIRKADKHK